MSQYRILTDSVAAARQLETEIVQSCRAHIQAGAAARRAVAGPDGWRAHAGRLKEVFLSAFPKALFDRAAIKAQRVSCFEYERFRVENVIFCSLPGWEVNASVYLPKQPGKYPCVVCPTGHSNKFGPNYAIPAQTFAQNGYIAVSFCPPGCAGELAYRNDHFANGLIGWLTGFWCQTHFVADALSCIDYLETRPDADLSRGVAMTGVSGGGLTAMYCAPIDERITFFAPVCCIAEQESLHFADLYTSCPEQHGKNYIKSGMDYVDILALSAPKKSLIVGGKNDEVFDCRATERLFEELKSVYALFGKESDTELYIEEETGHAYTCTMALEVVKRLNRIYKDGREAALPEIRELSRSELECRPLCRVNMFTVNADLARRCEIGRGDIGMEDAKRILPGLLGIGALPPAPTGFTRNMDAPLRWHHALQDVAIEHDSGFIPGLFLRRGDGQRRGAVLHIDDRGKWAALKNAAPLRAAAGYLEDKPVKGEKSVFSIDVSGFGELEAMAVPYDLAGWNDIERILAYLSVANGQCVMGYRARDALIALEFLRRQPDVDAADIVIAGRGIGGITALMAAALSGCGERVVLYDTLASYQLLCTEFPYDWNVTAVIPDILLHTDIPDLAACLGGRCTILRPLGATHEPLAGADAEHVYRGAILKGARLFAGDPAGLRLSEALLA